MKIGRSGFVYVGIAAAGEHILDTAVRTRDIQPIIPWSARILKTYHH
jgi:hypothetical protein